MKVVKASELGLYLYCRRAWFYQQEGLKSQNLPEMARGIAFHQRHGWQVLTAGLLKILAFVCLIGAALGALLLVFD